MRPSLATLGLILSAAGLAAQPAHVAPTQALSPADEQKSFTLPPGFEIQLVASEPEIGKPIQCAFDARGRLWVATSGHYPHAATGPATDKIYVLSDIDPATGRAGKVTAFADDLNIPIGVLPLPDGDSCLVSEVGRVVRLADTDGDGRCDRREVVLSGFGSKDTHGMTNSFLLMPDGWVYACHGFANETTLTGKDGHTITMQSGNTYRFRPDGSRVERFTSGQVNPFGLTFDPHFNLYTADCHSKPVTQMIPGATYQSFGKPHDGLGFAPHVARHSHGSTALCGLAWLESPQFPQDYQGTMVLGNVVTNRVNCDQITWTGASPVAIERPDLVASSDPWFRPVDCKLGPDGAVYVTDFYNKIIGHYEVDLNHPGRDKHRGRVWRIVHAKSRHEFPGDLTALPVAKVDALLGHANPVVRLHATLELKRRGTVPPADPSGNEFYQAHRVWIDPPAGRRDSDSELVRTHQILRSPETATTAGSGPRERQAKVLALAADPRIDRLPVLLAEHAGIAAADDHGQYAFRLALRNHLALDGGVAEADKRPEFAQQFAAALLGVPTPEAAAYLATSPHAAGPEAFRHVGRHGTNQSVSLMTRRLETASGGDRLAAIEALAQGHQSRQRPLPEAARALAGRLCDEGLRAADGPDAERSARLAQTLRLTGLTPTLIEVAASQVAPVPARTAAARAVAELAPDQAFSPLARLLASADTPPPVRVAAAGALGRFDTDKSRETLLAALPTAPGDLAQAVADALVQSKAGADGLLALVGTGKASPELLLPRPTRDRLAGHGLTPEVERLTRNRPTADQRLTALLAERVRQFPTARPDKALGKAVFAKNCAACHRLGDDGGKVGPQLDGVGNRGAGRLMEDILTPSRNVDHAFRATTIELADGRVVTGLVVRTEGAVVIVGDAEGREVRIPEDDIATRKLTPHSPMPANFDSTLTPPEFFGLVAYLLSGG